MIFGAQLGNPTPLVTSDAMLVSRSQGGPA